MPTPKQIARVICEQLEPGQMGVESGSGIEGLDEWELDIPDEYLETTDGLLENVHNVLVYGVFEDAYSSNDPEEKPVYVPSIHHIILANPDSSSASLTDAEGNPVREIDDGEDILDLLGPKEVGRLEERMQEA